MSSSVESPIMARKAYSYIRFSGKRQEAGDSYRRQEAMAESAAQEEGIPLDRTLTLADRGVSGFRGQNWKRGYLGKFIDLVDAGIVPAGSVLIIERVNRLSRLPWMEQVELWKEILRRGIIIRTCEPPSRYTAANMNDLAIGCPVVLFMMLGHQESKQKSQWIKAVWGEKKKQAQADNVPHGRMRAGWIDVVTAPHPKNPARIVTKGYRLNEERANVVRWIFEQAIAGIGTHRIGRMLRDKGVPSFQRSDWTPCSIRNILASRAAMGEYQPRGRDESGKLVPFGKRLSNYYPAAVTEEVFNAAQAALRSRRGKGGRQGGDEANLFTHLVS